MMEKMSHEFRVYELVDNERLSLARSQNLKSKKVYAVVGSVDIKGLYIQ